MPGRLFAVVPAAGRSRRMGRPKLSLPLGERTVLQRLLDALAAPEIVERVVVVRGDDDPLAAAASAAGAHVVRPAKAPPEMRDSVEHALRAIQERHAPDQGDGWILVPADHPVLEPTAVRSMIEIWKTELPEILVPTCGGRRGHPTIFRWELSADVFALPADCGLNRLMKDRAAGVREWPVERPSILIDLDTPEDYERIRREFESGAAASESG